MRTGCARARRGAWRPAKARGMTLVELMVGLAVMALLASMAAPYMGDFVANSRLREAGHLLLAETLMAQSEAVKRNTTVRVSTTASEVQVIDVTVAATPVVLRTRALAGGAQLPATTFDFGPEGRPSPFGTAVSINLIPITGACSTLLRCPGLRVDAGGATRLCASYLDGCS